MWWSININILECKPKSCELKLKADNGININILEEIRKKARFTACGGFSGAKGMNYNYEQ